MLRKWARCPSHGVLVCWLCGLGIIWLALIKPVHIDDTVVLHIAENILRDPLRPFAGEFFWLAEPGPLKQVTTNPPLVSYWLAPFIGLFGYREWVLHLSLMPFVALLGWGVHRLAERWLGEGWGWWAVGWVLLSPAVLPGLNLMRDVPMLGLFVGGLAFWAEGLARQDRRWLIIGALLGGLSALAKYTALIWLPIALVYTFVVPERSLRAVGWLGFTLVPITLWSLQNYWVEGEVHLLYLWQERRGSAPWETRLLPGITGIGVISLLSWGVIWEVFRRRLRPLSLAEEGLGGMRALPLFPLLLAPFVIGVMVAWYLRLFEGQPPHAQSLFWFGHGVLLLWLFVGYGRISGLSLFLWFWLGMGLMASVVGVPFQAIRHLLFLIPPLVLALMPIAGRSVWLLALQSLLTLAVQMADYEYAQVYRHYAQVAQERWAGARVWYAGSWGWMFYAEQAGFEKILPSGDGLQAGDILIIPERVYKGKMPPNSAERMELIEERAYHARIPLRTMDYGIASYYALIRTNAPFAFERERPLEIFRVYRWTSPP